MSLHKEINFEDEICQHLAEDGWLYVDGDAANYDRPLAVYPEDVVAWVKETQPEAWGKLEKSHGQNAESSLLKRLRDCLDKQGTLSVIRNGFDVLGLRRGIRMAEFKPALGMNPDIMARYQANRLRVVRQVRYSQHNENSIDLVLFLNGIPVATIELKTDFTQSIHDAVDQYRFDRIPEPKGKSAEPLLKFPSGALVHFAVSSSEVRMTTHLKGDTTFFLPFNQGDDGAAGNPINPDGHKTAYLWERIFGREMWLEILGRYLVTELDKKKQIKTIIFPRFHQLDSTRKLRAAVLSEGPGHKYLIQHSAGSGKTKTIAWTAHFLADLHDADDKKVFDSVIVISDRNVIDGQLQEELAAFERKKGVVATIESKKGSKSSQLATALSGDKKIVVCTIQTFPFALEAVRELTATEGKAFAVIADEAHSSQTGEAATKLKELLSTEERQQLDDGDEISSEDMLAAQMQARADDKNITYVAFTATPKPKTLELFGRRPKPNQPASDDNLPQPFHVYSMRQAIEEGFILDVLQNYVSYKLAFKLASGGKEWSDAEVERSAAMKGIMGWVKLHPYNIAQKVQIIVEHYRETIAPLLDGRAKAMVVVSSRLEAVRWQLAINNYIKDRGYPMKTLVAFSGEVSDKESGPDPFKESTKELNPGLDGRDIRTAFNDPDYQILLVANKFQTGFDQPLLCGMYIDKRLDGIQAVQTLSRLNRCHPGKDQTYVLDFVNDPEDILAAFKTYHATAELSGTTDPNIVLDLRTKLDATGYYDDHEVERVVAVELNPKAKQSQLEAAITPVADRMLKQYAAAKEAFKTATENENKKAAQDAKDTMNALTLFRGDMVSYLRVYTFLSQIFDYGNSDLEKRAIFYKHLIRLLKFGRERQGVDLSEVRLTHHNLKNRGKQKMNLREGETPQLEPLSAAGSGQVREKQTAYLSEIIEKVNDLFEGELTENDKLVYVNDVLKGKLLESETLQQQARNNTKEQFANSPDLRTEILNAVMQALDAHTEMSTQALNSQTVQEGLRDILIGPSKLYEALRESEPTLPDGAA
ncbi:type I restriction endonuclease subunit R [Rhodopirellula sp. MGV]|uniref:type I restriction endonuclease subunit R n=1 Tax=Rhodopirellula sp. MGV TaxID=2023130 RepID=UPI000B960473|nr:type I restriction endonuclease [Rhodopirellula sp. MGV]OYP28454.1 type I restriction endonuclease subunit R [Rhodopirellula sp. MGV]PNY38668.1 type I restriction endonuclease subunit R [Rhodopirellula baltica]